LPATQTPWSDVSSAFRRVSDTYRQLLDALLALDPKQRPKAQEALRLEPLGEPLGPRGPGMLWVPTPLHLYRDWEKLMGCYCKGTTIYEEWGYHENKTKQ